MKVIAGLGNPGAEYVNTPHSIGFEVVDALARAYGGEWKASTSFKGELATVMLGGVKAVLVKPMTFMNLSGECVAPVVKYHNASAATDLTVVSDDIDLPVGRLRVRKGGSPGGHNGLKSVIAGTGTADFIRLRLGVGRGQAGHADVIGHVLGKFAAAERAVMDEVVQEAVRALETILQVSVQEAMNRHNGWVATSAVAGEGAIK